MKIHRYQYLYLPVSRFFERFSPQTQLVFLVVKIAFVLVLVGFEFAHTNAFF